MANVTLYQANIICGAGFEFAKEKKLAGLTFVVLDAGGHVVSAQRSDNSGILRYEIAFGKAWGALGMGRSSRVIEGMAKDRPHFVGAAVTASGGRMVPVAGGVLIKDAAGAIVGAVGASGDTSDNDEAAAVAGIQAAGLGAQV